ncbi:O-antigen ligase family protein [Clostridium sp. 1001275B_160808_H3]|uniref:O-antigen ligase family protein n=1 Tax=Clostridium sp. 1001275B_160808_H3 TaxID=2787110 RepID=UPI00189BE2C8|nr:O-antigen ligase family protein [Clostridium sp. 1001275B_160808_H3]
MESINKKVMGALTKEIDFKILVNIILYSVIVIMPFIVVNVSSPRYVIGKMIFLYVVGVISIIALIGLKVTEFNIEHKIALVFMLTMLIPSILSPQKYVAFIGNIQRNEGFVMYCIYILLFILSSKYFVINEKLINLVLISSCVMGIYGILQFYNIDPVQFWMFGFISVSDSIGMIGNRNFFSSYLCIFLFISMAIYIFYEGKRYLIYSIILFGALITTLTRSGWLAFLVYSLIGLIFIIKDKKRLKKSVVVFISFLSIFLLLNLSTNCKIIGRATNSIVIDETGITKVEDSGRIEILNISWNAFKDHPFIGWGPDTLKYRLDSQYSESHREYINKHGAYIDKLHNEFLEYAVSNGIFNLIAYLLLIGVIIYNLIKSIRNDLSKLLLLTLIGYLVQSFFNISVIMVAPIFWIFLGFCVKEKEFELNEKII